MAIFSGFASTRGGERLLRSTWSAAKRFSVQMATGSSISPAAALGFAGVRADPAQDPGQRQALHDELHRLLVLAQLDELHVALDVDLRRAGEGAGGPVQLLDAEGRGNGLGIEAVGRRASRPDPG